MGNIKVVFLFVIALAPQNIITTLLGVKVKKSQVKIFDKEYQLFTRHEVYKYPNGKFIAGFITDARRNDTLFIQGKKIIEKDYILFREVYYHNISTYDSLDRKIVRTSHNKITVKEVMRYKDGKQY